MRLVVRIETPGNVLGRGLRVAESVPVRGIGARPDARPPCKPGEHDKHDSAEYVRAPGARRAATRGRRLACYAVDLLYAVDFLYVVDGVSPPEAAEGALPAEGLRDPLRPRDLPAP